MAEHPLVSILILNHNGKPFLDGCLTSVLASSYPNFDVVLVDNGSTDDSAAYTRAHYPAVKVFETGVNGGYSLAYNLALGGAPGKYSILLNNDVTVDPGWIEPLVDRAERDETIGVLQSKLLSMPDPSRFEYAGAAGGHMDRYGFPFLRGRVFDHMEKDEGQYDDEAEIFWASGAALFIRNEVRHRDRFLLDEDFVHHMEEIDMCWRLRLRGYTLRAIPSSVVYHYGGATITPASYRKMYWNHRNSTLMLLKNVGRERLSGVLFKRWLLDLMAIGYALGKLELKRVFAIIAGHGWILFHLPLILRKRRSVQAERKLGDDAVFQALYPKSIAIQYFLKGKRTYRALMEEVQG